MAIIIETGSGLPTANSYVSLAESDAYHLDVQPSWDEADSDLKAAALIKATRYVDGKYRARFGGMRLVSDQALEWPRVGVWDRDGYSLVGVPAALKAAVCEAALKALTTELTPDLDRGGAVVEETVGPITTKYDPAAPATTRFVAVDQAIARTLTASAGTMKVTR